MMKERVITSIVYESARPGAPAMVDISWWDDSQEKMGYATLFGKAAKALSQLSSGQIYYDETEDK